MSAARRALAPLAVARQRARSGQGGLLVFVVLVTVTMVLAAGLPRLAEAAFDDAARVSVAAAPAVARDLEFTRTDSLAPGTTDPLEAVHAAGAALQDELPASVGDLIVDRHEVVDSVEFVVSDPPVSITQLKFRIQSGLDERIRFVEGRAPAASDEVVELPGRFDPSGQPYVADVYEIALSSTSAETVRLAVGDELLLSPDEDDLIVQQYGTLRRTRLRRRPDRRSLRHRRPRGPASGSTIRASANRSASRSPSSSRSSTSAPSSIRARTRGWSASTDLVRPTRCRSRCATRGATGSTRRASRPRPCRSSRRT